MKRVRLWWVPVLLLVLPLTGRLPAHRDLLDFFAPMREHTALRLAAGELPWLNPGNGCGEAWFANPETGVLYPPHWLYIVLPASWGVTAEVALHLMLLSLGVGLLARRLGANAAGTAVAEVAAWSAGPVLATVGMVNNLDALAWLPWMVLAARQQRRTVPLLALTVALGWLAGEPQVWAVGVALAVAAGRHRGRAVAGALLGTAVVAVQLVPFLAWVQDGDRGAAAGRGVLAGAVALHGWLATLVPGARVVPAGSPVWAESLFLGAPLLLLVALGARRRPLLVLPALLLGCLASLPVLGDGSLYLLLTRGLVWYPSRFAVLGLATLLPLVGPGCRAWLDGRGRGAGAFLAVGALAVAWLAPTPLAMATVVAPAGVLLAATLLEARRWLRWSAVVAGLAGAVVAAAPLLEPRPAMELASLRRTPWTEARCGGRLHTLPPIAESLPRVLGSLAERAEWPVGYLNLLQDLDLTRSWAPVRDRRLAAHLAATNEPGGEWWIDALAARWVVSPEPRAWPGLVEVRRHGDLWLYRNRGAFEVASLSDAPPRVGRPPGGLGGVLAVTQPPGELEVAVTTPAAGWLWLSLAPTRGWRWSLDGGPVTLRSGPGIVQALPLTAGSHRLRGRYSPPGLVPAGAVSLVALLVVVVGLLRRSVDPAAAGVPLSQ